MMNDPSAKAPTINDHYKQLLARDRFVWDEALACQLHWGHDQYNYRRWWRQQAEDLYKDRHGIERKVGLDHAQQSEMLELVREVAQSYQAQRLTELEQRQASQQGATS